MNQAILMAILGVRWNARTTLHDAIGDIIVIVLFYGVIGVVWYLWRRRQ